MTTGETNANHWVVPVLPYSEDRSVQPLIRGSLIWHAAGQSDAEHARFYARQLLAAADELDRRTRPSSDSLALIALDEPDPRSPRFQTGDVDGREALQVTYGGVPAWRCACCLRIMIAASKPDTCLDCGNTDSMGETWYPDLVEPLDDSGDAARCSDLCALSEPARYREKSTGVEIEAMHFHDLDSYFAIVEWMKARGDTFALADEIRYDTPVMLLRTHTGTVPVAGGDWVVRAATGEFRRLGPDEFAATYQCAHALWSAWRERTDTLPLTGPRNVVRYRDCLLCDAFEAVRADGSTFERRPR